MSKFVSSLKPKLSSRLIRRRGLDRANELAAFAAGSLTKAERLNIQRAVNANRKLYGWSDERKTAEILALLEDGCVTYNDLAEESGIGIKHVKRLVRLMESRNMVTIGKSVRYGKGRPASEIRIKAPQT